MQDNSEIIEQLRADMEGLMSELSDLSRRNDELMTAKDSDLTVIRDLDSQLKEYKRKYEQAKTELRSVKGPQRYPSDVFGAYLIFSWSATSQLFLQAPKMEDQLPMGPDGGLVDIHVTAFVSAIDSLLTAGRSSAPTRVLVPMKAVVTSTTAIIDDVRAYEQRPSRADVDVDILHTLRERAEATLTNLVAASKTHATASGMSPVSLLDAAASHVSVTLTEIAKMIYIRKASRAEQEEFMSSSGSLSYLSSARSTEDVRPSFERKGSTFSTRRSEDVVSPPMTAASRFAEAHSRRTPSEPSSSLTSSPPPIFDKSPVNNALGAISDDSTAPESGEDAWSELKVSSTSTSICFVDSQISLSSPTSRRRPSPSFTRFKASFPASAALYRRRR